MGGGLCVVGETRPGGVGGGGRGVEGLDQRIDKRASSYVEGDEIKTRRRV
jgi:hypothetical protein